AVPQALGWLGVVLGLLVFAKVGTIYGVARLAKVAAKERHAQLAAGLGQIGEFSFVLGSVGVSAEVIPRNLYAALLVATVLSIAISATGSRLLSPQPSSA
ncbi:MAG TPA: cation:proton antiporter, partial [Candidatus Sulfotelmatobacter sp.]|nr:cation:proton antiporter [Candidatus Sulfotelmatobacter sp.]